MHCGEPREYQLKAGYLYISDCKEGDGSASVTLGTLSSDANDFCVKPEVQEVAADGGEQKERACDSLMMCIITTLNQGLRNGGGIGDILRAPSNKVRIIRLFSVN